MFRRQVAVLVPALVIELDEPHAALGQPAREQAVGGKVPGVLASGPYRSNVSAVSFETSITPGHAGLHAIRHLVLRDARVDFGVAERLGRVRVQVLQPIQQQPPALARDAVGIAEIEHRIRAAAELHALMLRRQEAAAPQARVERLVDLARRDQHDERRQVFVVAAQAVVHPRAHAGPPGDLRAGLEERDRRVVVDRVGEHRADDAEVVDDFGGVRQAGR